MRRRMPLAAAALTIALLPIGATAAVADAPGFSLSTDGATFSQTLSGSLFGDLGAIVPQDSTERTLWVRNDGAETIVIRVNAVDVTTNDDDYADALSLRGVTALQPSRAAMRFSTTETCPMLVGEQYLQAGAAVPIRFVLAMADLDGTTAQGATAGATLVVQARDAASPAPADSACDGDGLRLPVLAGGKGSGATHPAAHGLSSTGADPLLWVLSASALLVGGVVALVTPLSRRRKEERS